MGSGEATTLIRRERVGLKRVRPSLPPAYLAIPAAAVALVMLLPVAYLVLRAASGSVSIWTMLSRYRTPEILLNTVGLAAAVTAASIAVGVPIAWFTTRSDMPMRGLWAVLSVMPLAVPSLVGGYAFVGAFGYGGALHQLTRRFGFDFALDIYGFPGAWAVLTMLSFPYIVLSVRGALLGMDVSQEEASRSLGHGRWVTFRRVTLPLLRPAIASGGLLVALYVLSDFAAVSLLQFDTFTRAIYIQYETSFSRDRAAILSLILVVLTLLIVIGEARTRGRIRYHRIGSGAARRLVPVPLGRWRWAAWAFCALIVLPSLALPVGTSLYWLIAGMKQGEPLLLSGQAAWNSLSIAASAALVTVLAALPTAVVIVRYPGPVARILEQIAYAGYALPGIVVALALVFFGANYALPLYQTHALLLMAYGVLFFPQALGAIRTSLLQLNPNLEHASRGLGVTPFRTFWRVTVPLVRSGLFAAAGLVFLTVLKELPATLLLSPIGFHTLATQIWGAIGEAYYARAAAPALLLIATSSLSVGILLWQERARR